MAKLSDVRELTDRILEDFDDLCEKECLIKGRIDLVDAFGAIYVSSRALQPIVRRGDYIVVYRLREKDSRGVNKE